MVCDPRLSASGWVALAMLLDRSRSGTPVRAEGMAPCDLNELCAAGMVELTIGDDVTVSLSPVGLAAATQT